MSRAPRTSVGWGEEDRRLAAGARRTRQDLATSLKDLSVRLGETGRCEQALAAVEEAVTMRCRLAATDAAAHKPILAPALNNLSTRLGDVGRHEQALRAIEEEVTICCLLAASSAGYEPDLASLLQSLAVRLAQSTDTRKLTKLG